MYKSTLVFDVLGKIVLMQKFILAKIWKKKKTESNISGSK